MQVNSINNNSNPNFGMSATFKTKNMSRKAIDICTMAAKTIKKEAKGLDINVTKLEWANDGDFYMTVIATTHRNFFQKLFDKNVETFDHLSCIKGPECPKSIEEYVKLLEDAALQVKKKYFDESIEVGKKNLKNAMKNEKSKIMSFDDLRFTWGPKNPPKYDSPRIKNSSGEID